MLIALLYILVKALLVTNRYEPAPPPAANAVDSGFLGISYFGVDRESSKTSISTKQLEKHLKALYDSGYVTITQQDVLDYYRENKPLPEKALLLMFEDGRRDTAIFSQKIMEKYNFMATMFSYADKFEKRDPKFLSPSDMKDLVKSSYWELGTNGYRLEYINVFDRYDYYLGELSSLEFSMVAPYLGRKYDHYLMDYIRDEYGVPKESYDEMKARVEGDYTLLEDIYREKLGSVPAFYAIMHSNTGRFGSEAKVSDVNAQNLSRLFEMNINREGFSHNERKSSLYDLTRMQPQPHWSANHLLMRIWDDTGQDMSFVTGDADRAAKWNVLEGAAEFDGSDILLTSLPNGAGMMQLTESAEYGDLSLSVQLDGNALGSQAVLLRADGQLKNFLRVAIHDKKLEITRVNGAQQQEIYSERLDVIAGNPLISVEEDKKQTEIGRLNMRRKYSDGIKDSIDKSRELSQVKQKNVPTVDDGAEEFLPAIDLNEHQSKNLNIILRGDRLTVSVDGVEAVSALETGSAPTGFVGLEARTSIQKHSQRNLADDVYDGVFQNIVISDTEDEIIFDGRLSTYHRVLRAISTRWNAILNWFIETL